jgi:transposase
VLVDSPPGQEVCTGCGQRPESKGRATVHVRDLPSAGKATRLVWVKRIWRCGDCRVSWRERHPQIPSRAMIRPGSGGGS